MSSSTVIKRLILLTSWDLEACSLVPLIYCLQNSVRSLIDPHPPVLIGSSAMDASEHFSSCILPYVRQLVVPSVSSADLNESLDRASIVNNGQLVHRHTWLQARVDSLRPAGPLTHLSNRKRKVLLLGSGLVASPAVEVFAARSDLHLAVGGFFEVYPY